MRTSSLVAAGLLAAAVAVPALAQDQPTTAAPPAEKIPVTVKLAKGDRFAYRHTETAQQDIDAQGMQIQISTETSKEYVYEVLAAKDDGSYDLRVTIARVKGEINNPMAGGAIRYDSAEEFVSTGNPQIDMGVGLQLAYAGQSYEMSLSKFGQITEVRGADAMATHILDANPMAAMAGIEESTMNETQKTELLSQFGGLPEDGVAIGATWKRKFDITQPGIVIGMEVSSTVRAVADAEIAVDVGIKGAVTGGQVAAMFTFDELAGKGTTRYSREDGRLIGAETESTMSGKGSAATGGQGGLKVSSKTVVERIEPPAAKPTTPTTPTDDGPPGEVPTDPLK